MSSICICSVVVSSFHPECCQSHSFMFALPCSCSAQWALSGCWNCYCTYWEFLCQFANGNSKVHDTMEKCFHQATSFSEMELPGWKFLVNKKNILDHSFWAHLPILGWDMSPSILLVPMPLLDHHSGCNSGFSALPLALSGNVLFTVVISQLVWLLRQINWRATASALEVKFPEIHRLSRKEFDFWLKLGISLSCRCFLGGRRWRREPVCWLVRGRWEAEWVVSLKVLLHSSIIIFTPKVLPENLTQALCFSDA